MKKIFAAAAAAAFVGGTIGLAAPAQAIPPGPNTCISGGGPFASFQDCDLWPDGSFWHSVYGGFIGYGGFSGRVCDGNPPQPTDSDPRTPC